MLSFRHTHRYTYTTFEPRRRIEWEAVLRAEHVGGASLQSAARDSRMTRLFSSPSVTLRPSRRLGCVSSALKNSESNSHSTSTAIELNCNAKVSDRQLTARTHCTTSPALLLLSSHAYISLHSQSFSNFLVTTCFLSQKDRIRISETIFLTTKDFIAQAALLKLLS